jgi:hypothetical protein
MKRIALPWSLAVGGMDAATGLLLILTPTLVMRLLSIPPLPAGAEVLMGWIGTFVLSTGLSYGLCMRKGTTAETVWKTTAIVRIAVAVFLAVKIAAGALPAAWWVVAATDAAVAAVQGIGLKAGWWRD